MFLRNFSMALAVALSAVSCSDDNRDSANTSAKADATEHDDEDHESGKPGASEAKPLYAMMTQVYSDDDRTVYLSLMDSLDVTEVDLGEAREFAGVANFAAIGGKIFVSSGQAPTVTEFEISEDRQWSEERTINFADYPVPDGNFANFFFQYVVSEHAAYLPFDVIKRVVWDPTEMTIVDVKETSELSAKLMQGQLQLGSGGNRNAIAFKGPVLQPFAYHDEDYFERGDKSFVAVYDPKTHEETKVIELPCAGAEMTTQDEEGNTYFGTWGYLPLQKLYGKGPAPCVARVTRDLELDTAFTTDLTDQTDGLYVNNFRYIGKGKAIGNVLDHKQLKADFSKPYDPDVEEAAWKSGPHWSFWMFDIEADKAWPVEGIEEEVGSGAQFAVLDGRTFVFLPRDEWSRTVVYELDREGKASKRFEVSGDVFKWIRVR